MVLLQWINNKKQQKRKIMTFKFPFSHRRSVAAGVKATNRSIARTGMEWFVTPRRSTTKRRISLSSVISVGTAALRRRIISNTGKIVTSSAFGFDFPTPTLTDGSPIVRTSFDRGKDAEVKADLDRCVDDGSLEDNVESFLARDDANARDTVGRSVEVSKGFTSMEFPLIPASTIVQCCQFSTDGKVLATGGHDEKAVLWCTPTFASKSTFEEHSHMITDVSFSPSTLRIATFSADNSNTARFLDADNDLKSESNPMMNLRAFGREGSLLGVNGIVASKMRRLMAPSSNLDSQNSLHALYNAGSSEYSPNRSGACLTVRADSALSMPSACHARNRCITQGSGISCILCGGTQFEQYFPAIPFPESLLGPQLSVSLFALAGNREELPKEAEQATFYMVGPNLTRTILPLHSQDLKSESNPMMNIRAFGQEGSLFGVNGIVSSKMRRLMAPSSNLDSQNSLHALYNAGSSEYSPNRSGACLTVRADSALSMPSACHASNQGITKGSGISCILCGGTQFEQYFPAIPFPESLLGPQLNVSLFALAGNREELPKEAEQATFYKVGPNLTRTILPLHSQVTEQWLI